MPFEVLSVDGASAKWAALVEGLAPQNRDIHFLPDYGRIYRDSYGFWPFLALYEEPQGYVLQPFVRRSLGSLDFLSGAAAGKEFTDIANPYGYGGPLCSTSDRYLAQELYRRFVRAFESWCDDEDIASEFTSLHPFMADEQLTLINSACSPSYEKDVVFIDLRKSEADLLKGLRKGHRSSVSLARRAGVRVERVEPNSDNVGKFNELYNATMTRRRAAERWFVPQNYFANSIGILGDKRSSLFFAFVGDEVESACFVMHEFSTSYYHFAASRAKHSDLGVSNLMVFDTAIWLKRRGFERFHLGGGVTRDENDSLLRFKAGFSPLRAPLYTYFCVRDHVVYDHLCERKRMHEKATTGSESLSDFLPLYRR